MTWPYTLIFLATLGLVIDAWLLGEADRIARDRELEDARP